METLPYQVSHIAAWYAWRHNAGCKVCGCSHDLDLVYAKAYCDLAISANNRDNRNPMLEFGGDD